MKAGRTCKRSAPAFSEAASLSFHEYGFETNAIVTMEEVVEYLYNRPYHGTVYIDDACKAAIDAYYEQYGAK